MSVLPHGTWPSPVAPEALVAGQVGLDEVRPDGASTWWLELRPAEAGRVVLVRHDGTRAHDVLPAPWRSIRTSSFAGSGSREWSSRTARTCSSWRTRPP